MNFQKLLIALSAIILIAAFALISGCSNENGPVQSLAEAQVDNIETISDLPDDFTEPNPSMGVYFDTTFIEEEEFLASNPVITSIGGQMTIAWPFSSLQLMSDWTGWENERTPGSTIDAPYCNGRPSTHSGAEYYARDLNQRNGLDYGIMTFAGFAGKVIKAGDYGDGYGKQVVVYDPSRRVAIRYAHLSYIYHSGVIVGRYIPRHRFIGRTGNTGYSFGSHLHIAGYENLNSTPTIPTLCDSEHYTCQINFYWWNY